MIYKKHNYTADIAYLNNVFIIEYDISKANANVLFTKGAIDKKTYDFLMGSERMVRQRFVGNLQKNNPALVRILQQGIAEAKGMLFEANGLSDMDILSIKNDAVFVINKQLNQTQFGLIRFVPKNVYTSYYRIKTNLADLEMYYFYNNISKEERLDIKGIKDEDLKYHENYFIDILKDLFYAAQSKPTEIAIRMMKDIYMKYINLEFPVEYYRTFNNNPVYHLNTFTKIGTGFSMDNVDESMKGLIDISYNMHILLEIQKILMTMYFG